MNFLEELYYGNIKIKSPDSFLNERYKQATDIVLSMTTKLKEALAEPERTMLERLLEAEDEIIEETGLSDFKFDFSLGVQMMVDCFTVKND